MTLPATFAHDVQFADGWKSFEHHHRYAARVIIGTCFEPSWDESDHYLYDIGPQTAVYAQDPVGLLHAVRDLARGWRREDEGHGTRRVGVYHAHVDGLKRGEPTLALLRELVMRVMLAPETDLAADPQVARLQRRLEALPRIKDVAFLVEWHGPAAEE